MGMQFTFRFFFLYAFEDIDTSTCPDAIHSIGKIHCNGINAPREYVYSFVPCLEDRLPHINSLKKILSSVMDFFSFFCNVYKLESVSCCLCQFSHQNTARHVCARTFKDNFYLLLFYLL